ncbi:MAG: acyltransferase [Eubacteriales bacterium]|nr:acyltransferase [Eubacteriales bacterium]
MEEKNRFENKYIYSFDSLKGIIIIVAVVIGHYWQFTPGEYWSAGNNAFLTGITNTANQLSFKTYSLMELLLMIGGFQMWRQRRKIASGQIRFLTYLRKRAVRLLPMSIITTIVMAVGLVVYQSITGEVWHDMVVNVRNLLENFLGIQIWFRPDHTLNGPLWYVSVYFACTILFYLLIRLAGLLFGGHKIGYCFMMLIPILFGIYGSKNYLVKPLWNPDLCRGYMGFFAGVLVAALAEFLMNYQSKLLHRILWMFCLLLMIVYIIIDVKFENVGISGSSPFSVMVTESLFYAPVLLLLSYYETPDKIIGNKVLAYFGKASFHVYVWNFPFCLWVTILDKVLHLGIPFPMWYMLWVQTAIQIGIGIVSYYCEKSLLYKFNGMK